jgi:prepilin-type N-terminal cleavage/methylation domain-containing protein
MQKRLSDQKAFTLIEVIVSLVLLGILAAIAGMGIVKITEGYVFTKQNAETAQKAQIAMARISKELGAATAVTAATANSISYIRPGPVTNTIALSGTTVQITGTTLIDQVTAFTLTYNYATGVTAPTPADIRQVFIRLTVEGVPNPFENRVTTALTASEPY